MTANLPENIKAWHSTDTLDHLGSWATTRYPEDALEYTRTDLTIRRDDPVLKQVVEAVSAQLQYMDMCNDRGDLERNMRTALAALQELMGGGNG